MPDDLRLWEIDLDAAAPDLELLSADERDRAARFRFPIHQRRFIAGRAALRTILGQALGTDPRAVRFDYSSHGKPAVDGLEFNLAHSENLGLLAFAHRPVGVDLEFARTIEFESVAKTVCTPAELALWTLLPPTEKPRAFYALWTRKEALLKGIGCGIVDRVQDVSVFFDNLSTLHAPPGWEVRSFPLKANFPAAVAFQIL